MKRIQIKARGFTFDALSDGPEDGPLLILLHGLPRTSWEWHHQIPKFAEAGFRTIAPDMRGYSPGARPEGKRAYKVKENSQLIRKMRIRCDFIKKLNKRMRKDFLKRNKS